MYNSKYVEVIRDLNPLEQLYWRFYYMDHKHELTLDAYEIRCRETTRHKMKAKLTWSRLDQRSNKIPNDSVPLTDDVAKEAIEKFTSKIKVVVDRK